MIGRRWVPGRDENPGRPASSPNRNRAPSAGAAQPDPGGSKASNSPSRRPPDLARAPHREAGGDEAVRAAGRGQGAGGRVLAQLTADSERLAAKTDRGAGEAEDADPASRPPTAASAPKVPRWTTSAAHARAGGPLRQLPEPGSITLEAQLEAATWGRTRPSRPSSVRAGAERRGERAGPAQGQLWRMTADTGLGDPAITKLTGVCAPVLPGAGGCPE